MNEEYWTEFLREFSFLYEEIYHKLIICDEIKLLVTNYTKELLNWGISTELEEILLYSNSIKSYVLVNHLISGNLREAISKIQTDTGEP